MQATKNIVIVDEPADGQAVTPVHIENPEAIEGGGDEYELPTADVDTLGGVKVSANDLGGMNAVDTYIDDGVVKGRVPNADASTPGLVKQAASVAAVSAPDATSTASTETVSPAEFAALVTLANANKAAINGILDVLKASGCAMAAE